MSDYTKGRCPCTRCAAIVATLETKLAKAKELLGKSLLLADRHDDVLWCDIKTLLDIDELEEK